jgi:hypothetical protein
VRTIGTELRFVIYTVVRSLRERIKEEATTEASRGSIPRTVVDFREGGQAGLWGRERRDLGATELVTSAMAMEV